MNFDHIFREYDIRGIFQQDLNQEIVYKIGYTLASVLKSMGEESSRFYKRFFD